MRHIIGHQRKEIDPRDSQALLLECQRLGRTGYIMVDMVNRRVFWSETVFELRRVPSRESFNFREAIDFIHPEDRAKYHALTDLAIAERRNVEIDVRILRGDGSIGWEHSLSNPRFDESGNLVGLLVVLRDVSEAKEAEIALHENQALLLESQRLGKTGYVLSDLPRNRAYWSETLFELRRVPKRPYFTVEESMGFLHPEDAAGYMATRIAAMAARQPFEIDTRTVRGDGSIGWEHRVGRPRFDDAGNLTGVLVVLRDITDEKLAAAALAEKDRQLNAIMDHAPVGIFLKDRAGRFQMVNKRFQEWFGRSADHIIGLTGFDFASRELSVLAHETDLQVLAGAGVLRLERPGYGMAQAVHDVAVTKFAIRNEAGEIVGISGFIEDITERKRAELAARENERQLRAIMDNAPVGIFLKDLAGRYLRTNRRLDDFSNWTQETAIGKTIDQLLANKWIEIAEATDRAVIEKGEIVELESPTFAGRGDYQHASVIKFPVRDDAGKIVAIGGVITNVTERIRAEQALRQREADLRAIMDNAPLAIFLKDRDGRFRFINRCYTDWFGIRPEDIYGRTNAEMFPESVALAMDDSDRHVLEHGRAASSEIATDAVEHKAGIETTLITKFPIPDEVGDIVGVAGFSTDITARKRAEQALRESETRFRALIEQSIDLVVVVDADGFGRYVSPSVTEVLGYSIEETARRTIFDFVHPDDVDSFRAGFQSVSRAVGDQVTIQGRLRHKDGSWRVIDFSARNAMDVPGVEGIIVNGRDITKAKTLEERLLQAQKMEAVGQLAGGIAHDFNNIIGAILGFAGFLMEDLPGGSPQLGFARRIVNAGTRAKELVQQILAFSRRSSVERSLDDIGRIVRETQELLRASLPSSTRLELAIEGEGLIGNVNKGQINQILMNLCLNANDALEGEPGDIVIGLGKVVPGDADYWVAAPWQPAGPTDSPEGFTRATVGVLDGTTSYARIAVRDTGKGFAPDIGQRLFDPFFTTKPRGRGTGLGLAVVHGIVTSYDGACRVESKPGEGTTFAVYLPLSRQERPILLSDSARPALRGNERILVIDDDAGVADVLVIGLGRLGYAVTAFGDPVAAAAAFAQDPDRWDVVISDQVMPQLKGLMLFARFKAIKPSLRFILCTGFSDVATETQAIDSGIGALFIKPVSPERLAACIRELAS